MFRLCTNVSSMNGVLEKIDKIPGQIYILKMRSTNKAYKTYFYTMFETPNKILTQIICSKTKTYDCL